MLPPFMDIHLRVLNCPTTLDRGQLAEVDLFFPQDVDRIGLYLAQGIDLHVFGLVEYFNEDGGSHWTTAFCRRELVQEMRMIPVEDPEYEYED